MAQVLFSEGLADFTGRITNSALLESLKHLAQFQQSDELKLLIWDDSRLAVSLLVEVDIPPLGTVGSVDIKSFENILLVINPESYPNTAPVVFTDRMDFPKNILGHLYVSKVGKPPAFCLIRGSMSGINEWYADKQMKDIIIRTRNWLRDAANGSLLVDGSQFEPLRLEGYCGSATYDYDTFAQIVRDRKSFYVKGNFSRLIFEDTTPTESILNWKFIRELTEQSYIESVEESIKENKKEINDQTKKSIYQGFLIWSENDEPISNYDVLLPENWMEFKSFCTEYDIELDGLEKEIVTNTITDYFNIPVIVAIKRPKPIIGFTDSIEFINFYVELKNENLAHDKIADTTKMSFGKHSQPLTFKKAREISGQISNFSSYSLIAGCGALGSKIALHLARGGNSKLVFADPDTLSPHNFVRHALSAKYLNQNKAIALAEEVKHIFPEYNSAVFGHSETAEKLIIRFQDAGHAWGRIFDFSASTLFANTLINIDIKPSTQVAKAYISDFGNLGILLFEGNNRNPRIDDLQAALYQYGMTHEKIQLWLNRESATEVKDENFIIGIGCNSETTVLSDDTISIHAALFSGVIKNEIIQQTKNTGKIYLNEIFNKPFFSNASSLFDIQPFDIYKAENDTEWDIRFADGIIPELRHQMKENSPLETGGVLVGCANYKTKTIHVTSVIKAPPDSKANKMCFFRGKDGLSEVVQEVTDKTGGQLGYIGEWHSHPEGPNGMSRTDIESVRKFQREFNDLPTPLPVFLLIITPTKELSFVF